MKIETDALRARVAQLEEALRDMLDLALSDEDELPVGWQRMLVRARAALATSDSAAWLADHDLLVATQAAEVQAKKAVAAERQCNQRLLQKNEAEARAEKAEAERDALLEWPCEGGVHDGCRTTLTKLNDDAEPGVWFCGECWNKTLGKVVAERNALAGQVAAHQSTEAFAIKQANQYARERYSALAQVAALRAEILNASAAGNCGDEPDWEAMDRVIADTARAAAEHDAKVRRETLKAAMALCHEGGLPAIDSEWCTKDELRALAAKEET